MEKKPVKEQTIIVIGLLVIMFFRKLVECFAINSNNNPCVW